MSGKTDYGKGSRKRELGKDYEKNYDRIFGKGKKCGSGTITYHRDGTTSEGHSRKMDTNLTSMTLGRSGKKEQRKQLKKLEDSGMDTMHLSHHPNTGELMGIRGYQEQKRIAKEMGLEVG